MKIDFLRQEIVKDVWQNKYRYVFADGTSNEQTIEETIKRVVDAVYIKDPDKEQRWDVYNSMVRGDFVPGGRILAGAGTDRNVTLINCYVNRTVEDSLKGIMKTLNETATTMQMGGGIGTDFSTLRPDKAIVLKIDTEASGPLPFMDTWNAMCKTIQSSGARRGAMMATMAIDHPDVWYEDHLETYAEEDTLNGKEIGSLKHPSFITAKREKNRLTQFNVSILVSDLFMEALKNDEDWDLGFHIPRADGNHVDVKERDGKPWYVYSRVKAQRIWDDIIKNTYEFAEPGIIFIDRVNKNNNLYYLEDIRSTNPCGEQPLPPFGACNLGAINLANFILNPYTDEACVDEIRLKKVISEANRFLDNVLDVTNYPIENQKKEAVNKRRTGLGVMGLGNMLIKLGVRYGGDAVKSVENVMKILKVSVYEASANLAVERGAFPLFDAEKHLLGENIKTLPKKLKEKIASTGIRNGVLLTIAPTGTTAMFAGNESGGLEPAFSFRYFRKMIQDDGTTREYPVMDKGWMEWCYFHDHDPVIYPTDDLPEYMITALNLSVKDHLVIQATCQKYIDSSISKTINCPEKMTFEEFRSVYLDAYNCGLKGCTTYRPSPVRGSVLSLESSTKKLNVSAVNEILNKSRHRILSGTTYKEKWPHSDNIYITVNDIIEENADGSLNRRAYEVFFQPNSPDNLEMCVAMGKTLSAILRLSNDIGFILSGLKGVQSPDGGAFWKAPYDNKGGKAKRVPSLVSLFAHVLEAHIANIKNPTSNEISSIEENENIEEEVLKSVENNSSAICPKCYSQSLIHSEGCKICKNCDYSVCG